MEIYKFIKPLRTNLGGNYIPGDRIFKIPHSHIPGDYLWEPENGGYSMWDKQIPVQDFVEYVGETDKPLSYFQDKKYSQYQLDELLKKNP